MTRFADLTVTAGPGDPETWPPPTGHPLDPRTDDDGWDESEEWEDPRIAEAEADREARR